ncbi:hypothetical protein [Deinococcus pimensis]|uniref:hypothetical protein n=1 Tax=Deinococcus pimensis TaxID=309888 RepID=UPI00048552C4|nr:hypothetical protein [Deinococcus pimensis]
MQQLRGYLQSVDAYATITIPDTLPLAVTDTARMQLRQTLKGGVIDTLTTENDRIRIEGQDVILDLPGERSALYAVRFKTVVQPIFRDDGTPGTARVPGFSLLGRLIVTEAGGRDRFGLDLEIIWSASATRGPA